MIKLRPSSAAFLPRHVLLVQLPTSVMRVCLPGTLQAAPPPALINADMICRAPDNVLLLLVLLRPEPEGCEDFYVRYGALQALNGLLKACPDKLQVCLCCVTHQPSCCCLTGLCGCCVTNDRFLVLRQRLGRRKASNQGRTAADVIPHGCLPIIGLWQFWV